jgi:hypothetical protein
MFDTPNIAGFGYADTGSTAGAYERDEFGNEVWSLALTLAWKLKFNRPKDQEDVRLVTSRAQPVSSATVPSAASQG